MLPLVTYLCPLWTASASFHPSEAQYPKKLPLENKEEWLNSTPVVTGRAHLCAAHTKDVTHSWSPEPG